MNELMNTLTEYIEVYENKADLEAGLKDANGDEELRAMSPFETLADVLVFLEKHYTGKEIRSMLEEDAIRILKHEPQDDHGSFGYHLFVPVVKPTLLEVWGRLGARIEVDAQLWSVDRKRALAAAIAAGSFAAYGDTYLVEGADVDDNENFIDIDYFPTDKLTFLDAIEHAITHGYQSLTVEIAGVGVANEFITNPHANMASKKEYYATAYDEHLRLIANPSIRIAGYSFTK